MAALCAVRISLSVAFIFALPSVDDVCASDAIMFIIERAIIC